MKLTGEAEKAVQTLTTVLGAEAAKAILELLEALTSKKRERASKGEPSLSSEIWNAYADAYFLRYRRSPARNAKVNGQAAYLLKLVGLQDAVSLAAFYVRQNDAFYLRQGHPLGLLLKDYQMLLTRMHTGLGPVTASGAQKLQAAQVTASASASYLQKKYGEQKPKKSLCGSCDLLYDANEEHDCMPQGGK